MSPAAVVPIRKDRGAEWLASIPAQLSAREALPLIETALKDAKDATDEIVSRFSGTLPPPPWPKHAELETAIKAMEGGRLLMQKAIEVGHGDTKQPKDGPNGKRLQNVGTSLYREIARMQDNMRGITAADIPGLVAKAAARVATTQWGGLLTIGLLLYALHELHEGER